MMQQLSLLEIKPLMLPEQVESKQKEIMKLRKQYDRLRKDLDTAKGWEARNLILIINDIKRRIAMLEGEEKK